MRTHIAVQDFKLQANISSIIIHWFLFLSKIVWVLNFSPMDRDRSCLKIAALKQRDCFARFLYLPKNTPLSV